MMHLLDISRPRSSSARPAHNIFQRAHILANVNEVVTPGYNRQAEEP